ncbi:MAG: hypothetical protein JNM24_19130 [Bdellovibrionaceae bacterium]|nr:hypothetical protein [Pseudobdellovibrionaceae bacterium]
MTWSSASLSFTLLADFESVTARKDGRAVLVNTDIKIGVVSDIENNSGLRGGSFGTYYGSNIGEKL